MPMLRHLAVWSLLGGCLLRWSLPARAAGARLYKSGPIQITADGKWVWVANTDNDSVTRIETATDAVLELRLPDTTSKHSPRGLSLREDGSEVWVACHDSDRVYVLGSDGRELAAVEVRAARDVSPPRIVRVEPASLTAVDVWFSETVDATSAANPLHWRLEGAAGRIFPITAAVRDNQNGDRVTLTTILPPPCEQTTYKVVPTGQILDAAASASGGTANALDLSHPDNTRSFVLNETLTITLGASGYENSTIAVHDAGMVGPGLSTWGHDAPWLFPVSGGSTFNTGFVRFDWRMKFATTTAVAASSDLVAASLSLCPEWGDAQTIEIRRALLAWKDPASGGDWNSNPTDGPTWRDHAHPSARWNAAGAQALGGTGGNPADYDSIFDLAAVVDASVSLLAINERVTFGGARVSEAFRFWFDNPALDHGYAFRLAPGGKGEVKFESSEASLQEYGSVLTLTYRLPGVATCVRTLFHRGDPDATGVVDITDAIFVLQYLFVGGAVPPCLEAADIQDDGAVDIADAVAILLHLFAGNAPPAPPGPPPTACGVDPPTSPVNLGCGAYPGC